MFCARCGKEIDNDSTFCPFCGQKTDEPVESGGGSRKPRASVKTPSRKVIVGIAAVVAVFLIVFGISRLIGGIGNRAESLSEKLFAMSWEEISEISEDDFKEMLDEAGTLYNMEAAENSLFGMKDIKTKTTEFFMGGDCLYLHVPEGFATLYGVRYETEEDFKSGREQIEEILQKSLLENTVVYERTYAGMKAQFYPIGVSDKNLNGNLDTVDNVLTFYGIDNVDELDAEELTRLNQCYMYKFAFVIFGNQNDMSEITDEFVFPSDKSYTNYMCVLGSMYSPMREEDLISRLAFDAEHDVISGKEIDIDKMKESVDERLVNAYLDEKAEFESEEYRRKLEEKLYIRLYMMEKHKFDTELNTYLKTDDEKRLWYVRNFNWDTNTDAPIDLSAYRNSGDIYCAAECNYNSDTAEYFENELDRALYLADKDYKADTGESFGGTDDKRLWFMQNYSYDTSSGKAVDKEVVDALVAYQKYIDDLSDNIGSEVAYSMIYLNEDNIPECLVWSKPYKSYDNTTIYGYMELRVLSYIGKNIQKIEFIEYSGCETYFEYTPREGKFFVDEELGLRGAARYSLVELNPSEFNKIGEAWYDSENAGEYQYYSVNGADVSQDEFDNWFASFNFDMSVDDRYNSILIAYDNLRLIKYETYEYCIYEYELKDDVLTVKADDGANKSSSFGAQTAFEFSYPVADNCIWEAGNGFDEYRSTLYSMTSEELEVEIKNWRNMYELTPDNMESPVAIQFHIIDDQVVGVYTSIP